MEISNLYDDLSITDVQEKAAPVGDSLRVAVTKTSAQGKAAQSATPNLMSFSTDENSIWFNGKKYGVYVLKEFNDINDDSNSQEIQSFLGDFTYDKWEEARNVGSLVFVTVIGTLCPAAINVDTAPSDSDILVNIFVNSNVLQLHISVQYSASTGYSAKILFDYSVNLSDIVNSLDKDFSDKPLSAAMGKKLQDEKLSETDANDTYLTKVNAESTYAKKADGISHYSIGELTALSSNPTQEQLKTALGTPSAFRNAIDAGKLILVTGHVNEQSQKSAICIIDSGNVIVKYPHPGNNDWTVIAKCVPMSSGDNWDNAQFSVRIIKSSDISYTTNLPDSLVVPQTIGGITKGTKVSDLEGSTISQMFDNLLFPEVQPTVQNPSASISFKDTFSSNGVYEVGATAPIAANFNTSFSRGTCTVVGQANKNRAGTLNSSSSFIYYGGNTSTKTLPTKITLGTMQYNYQAAYAQGDTLVTSKGNKASVTPNPLPAGNVNSGNLTIFGTYPYYCNGQNASSSSGDTNFPTSATPDTKLPLYKWTDTLVGAKFASEATTGTRMQFMYSNRKNVTKVEFYNTISGKWETFGTSNYNAKSSTKTYNIQGVNETYNILTTTGPLSGSVQYRFTMTNA